MQKWNLNLFLVLLLFFGLACANEPQVADQAADNEPQAADRDIFVPSTISSEARQVLNQLILAKPYTRAAPSVSDLENWRKLHDAAESGSKGGSEDWDLIGTNCPLLYPFSAGRLQKPIRKRTSLFFWL